MALTNRAKNMKNKMVKKLEQADWKTVGALLLLLALLFVYSRPSSACHHNTSEPVENTGSLREREKKY